MKILKVIPINYDLKSNLEKESILNSYKTFFKTCNFNSQILIQSKKENLSKHLSKLKEKEVNSEYEEIYKKYYEFISNLNEKNDSASNNYFIVIKSKVENSKDEFNKEKEANNNLKEKYYKIKEALAHCGNQVIEIDTKEKTEDIINSFYKVKNNFTKGGN